MFESKYSSTHNLWAIVTFQFSTITISFNAKGQQVQIKGDPSLTKKIVTPQGLLKETKIEAVTLVWVMGTTELDKEDELVRGLTQKQQAELERVLEVLKVYI